jgi:hypothetical protein
MPPPSRERACARLSLITVSSATGVSGLCRQRAEFERHAQEIRRRRIEQYAA